MYGRFVDGPTFSGDDLRRFGDGAVRSADDAYDDRR